MISLSSYVKEQILILITPPQILLRNQPINSLLDCVHRRHKVILNSIDSRGLEFLVGHLFLALHNSYNRSVEEELSVAFNVFVRLLCFFGLQSERKLSRVSSLIDRQRKSLTNRNLGLDRVDMYTSMRVVEIGIESENIVVFNISPSWNLLENLLLSTRKTLKRPSEFIILCNT